tara:strand:+ start:309 stop:839 length:531 start_codon:yes stop_codon:yes gene_type:complete
MKLNFKKFFIHPISFYKNSFYSKIKFFIGFSFLTIIWGITALTFATENSQFEKRFNQLSNKLRCPTCQGLSVKDSDAVFSTSIKSKISELIKQGKSDKEIMAYFVERYGEWILRAPPVSGFNIVLWVLPSATIITGLIWVLYKSKNWVEKPTKEFAGLTPEEEQKIKNDLGRFEKS